MSEYIKREDAAEQAIAELEEICVTSPEVKAKVRSDYEQIPDAIVRCKDCKWWTILPHEQQFIKDKTFGRCSTWSDMAMTDIGMHKDYYCSYGERKEQEYE